MFFSLFKCLLQFWVDQLEWFVCSLPVLPTAIIFFLLCNPFYFFSFFIYIYLLYRHECFTGKYTTRKIHKNYIRDPSGLFSIISHVSLSMISLISSLSLKLYLNSLVYHRNIFGSSSKVFGNLRTSSEIFGNSRKMFGNVRLAFEQFW